MISFILIRCESSTPSAQESDRELIVYFCDRLRFTTFTFSFRAKFPKPAVTSLIRGSSAFLSDTTCDAHLHITCTPLTHRLIFSNTVTEASQLKCLPSRKTALRLPCTVVISLGHSRILSSLVLNTLNCCCTVLHHD